MQGYFSQACAGGWGWNNQSKEELVGATLQGKEDLKKEVTRVQAVCSYAYFVHTIKAYIYFM